MNGYNISAAELQWAFEEFDRLNLRDISYSDRHSVIAVMGRFTNEDPRISAGCETGIKLGMLIAARRMPLPDPPGVQLAPNAPHVPVEVVSGVTGFDPTREACEEFCYCEPTKPCPKLASSAEEGK